MMNNKWDETENLTGTEKYKMLFETAAGVRSMEKATILTHFLEDAAKLPSDSISCNRGESSGTSNKIRDYRRIRNWENFFLCSGICSVGQAVGSNVDDYHFYANFTGDNFAYLYAAEKGNPKHIQCDSGITNYFFMPEAVKRAYAAFGYECIYVSQDMIRKDYQGVINAVKMSVDKKIPVLSWGMGNVTCLDGSCWNPLPEACLIGGYREDDALYVNLYLGAERLPKGSVDEWDYSVIVNGLKSSRGLFFVGQPLDHCDRRKIYENVIASIPTYLTLPPAQGDGGAYVFGKKAFEIWAETLETDALFDAGTEEAFNEICWNLHCSPYCCICTSSAYGFFQDTVKRFPDLKIAKRLLPFYKTMEECCQEIWDFQGGFFPPHDKFGNYGFRAHIAGILREMGALCDEILKVYLKS